MIRDVFRRSLKELMDERAALLRVRKTAEDVARMLESGLLATPPLLALRAALAACPVPSSPPPPPEAPVHEDAEPVFDQVVREKAEAKERADALAAELAQLKVTFMTMQRERDEAEHWRDEMENARDVMEKQRDEAQARVRELEAERDTLKSERDAASAVRYWRTRATSATDAGGSRPSWPR